MKKVKRYSAGGMGGYEDTDDYKNLISAQEREDVGAIGDRFAKDMKEQKEVDEIGSKFAKTLKKDTPSFKTAFAAARKSGDKTFEWNGKKYTTELASEKKPAKASTTSTAPSSSDRSVAKADSSNFSDRMAYKRATQSKMAADKKAAAGAGYKSGGTVSASRRADGCAQRGKTRGKMV